MQFIVVTKLFGDTHPNILNITVRTAESAGAGGGVDGGGRREHRAVVSEMNRWNCFKLQRLLKSLTSWCLGFHCRYLMGVASLGGEGSCTAMAGGIQERGEGEKEEEEDAGLPDYAGARYYLETAQQMMDRVREEAAAQAAEAREQQDCTPVRICAVNSN